MFRGMFGLCAIQGSWMSGVLCGATGLCVFAGGAAVCFGVLELCVWSSFMYLGGGGTVVGEDGCPSGEMKS